MRTALDLLIWFMLPITAGMVGWFATEDFQSGMTVGLWSAGVLALVVLAGWLWGLWRDYKITRLHP